MIHQSDTPKTDEAICGSEPFNDEHVVLADFARQLERENAELQRWKSEQLAVESTWDAQAVGRLLGVRLGQPIRPEIQPSIEAMREAIKAAHAAIATQIHVRGTSDDTLDVLAQQESALAKLSPFLK